MSVFEAHNLSVIKKGTLQRVPFLNIKEKVLGKGYNLSISFVDEKQAKKINKKFRKKDYIPNTLSFSLTKSSGEIIMCASKIKKEAPKFGLSYNKFLVFLLIHSMLHLKGMRHGSTMEAKEQYYFAFFR